MDFESYIGRERQLLARIERERAELNSHEPRAETGNYQLAEDEIRLLKAGDYVAGASEVAADAVAALDERISALRKAEHEANARNEAFVRRVAEWETKFDARYAELTGKIAREMAALESRNAELTRTIEEAEQSMRHGAASVAEALNRARHQSEANIRHLSEATEANIRQLSGTSEASLREISEATTADVDRRIESLRQAQAAFEAAVNEKLENDKQTIERIKYMITAMNEIIKT
jgi:vacuolar-type H+-ATPase subunit I/STV1